ncbi:hypothetical protein B4589_012715 [Halolamina sp. CBA1230]|uniref:hypothetical protein n=1 Tax=Halolamina sp. CBA1230 TaxID=1853690 RepID=UPI001179A9ED|nr:hypothetical protein [Halolamina sp. CBA1230]QKY21193.1 hypothetical protein B4589_012715 [Halolamina sp. CBA1230]
MYFDQIQIVPTTGRHAEQVPKDFFYSRVIEKNESDFQEISPQEEFNKKVRKLVREQREQIGKELEEFGEPVSTVAQDVLFAEEQIRVGFPSRHPQSAGNTTKYTGEQTEHPVLLFVMDERDKPPHRRSEERSDKFKISILAKTSEDGESFIGFFANEIHEISTYVGDYAEAKELTYDGEIVHEYFDKKVKESSNITDWYLDEENNDFEDEVFDSVCELTGIALENVRIQVDVGDNPDFDAVALPLGGMGTGYAIEVKDYSQEDNDAVDESPSVSKDSGELRSELIRKPKDYAEQADLQLITVVRGLSEEQYEDLHRLADSSNVALLNEDNYEERLSNMLFEQKLREMSEFVV